MQITRIITATRKQAEAQAVEIREELRSLPKEKLTIHKRGGKFYCYAYKPGRKRQKYLSQKDAGDAAYTRRLARKYILEAKLRDCADTIALCNAFLKKAETRASHESALREKRPYLSKLAQVTCFDLSEIEKWEREDFAHNNFHPENLKHRGPNGIMMRSKSETAIGTALAERGIPFRYECALDLNGLVIYPDFTILDPRSRALCYWEHLGILDDDKYIAAAANKISSYIRAGFIPGVNLILSGEVRDRPFGTADANRFVDFYFG